MIPQKTPSLSSLSSQYFTKKGNEYSCNMCETVLNLTNSGNSNLVSHLKSKHFELFKKLSFLKETASSSGFDNLSQKIAFLSESKNIHMFTKFFSLSQLPINILADSEFQFILSKLDSKIEIPSQYQVKELLLKNSLKYKEDVKLELQNAGGISLSIDIWNYNSLLAISCCIRFL